MGAGGTIAQRITDLIGAVYSTEADYEGDLINAAINEIADMIPTASLIRYSRTPGVLTSNSEWLTEDRKILEVVRIDADSNGIERPCTEVNKTGFSAAGDSGSIYASTPYSPVYYHDTENAGASTLKILPEPTGSQKGKIWYFSYVSGNNTTITQATLNTSLYIPSNAIHAIVLKSCLNILKAYVSNQVQDEEDIELLQMLQGQIQILEKDYQTEMQRFTTNSEEVKAE